MIFVTMAKDIQGALKQSHAAAAADDDDYNNGG